MKRLKVGIISVGHSANVGDGLIASMIKSTLDGLDDNFFIDVSFFDIDFGEYDISESIIFDDTKKSISDFKNRFYLPRAIKNTIKNLTDKKYKNKALKFIQNQDVIIVGGGHLLIDNYAHFLSKIYVINKLCKKNNINLFYWCVGVSERFSPISKVLLSKAINNRKVYTRDSNSLIHLKYQLGDNIKAKCIADPAIFCGDFYATEIKKNSIAIGIMDPSEMRRHSKYEISREDFSRKYIKLLNNIPKEYEVKVFCNGNINDFLFIEKFILPSVRRDNVNFMTRPESYNDLIEILSDCEYVFAQRLHAVLPSISLGKKVVALKWDSKLESIISDLDLRKILYEPSFDENIVNDIINSEKISLSALVVSKDKYMNELRKLLEEL
ncbi:polysaccharide pyruvyl transferase family protein [Vibrio alginolyticus]|uniref:polysaccharide pyruvyl transferase family protein n=1 Tax=Vibrio alginolyticus TaxID=663 RepID=UPI0013030B4D|nr:polysaccharide pyruvyl transferase family protein [Vibrio alginolyticus]